MDFLSNEQINFDLFNLSSDPKSSFKIGFISKRLCNLITDKLIKSEWKVLQFPLNHLINFPGFIPYPEYKIVFTSPTKGTVLAIKNLYY